MLAESMKSIDSHVCFVAVGDGMEKDSVIREAEQRGVLNRNLFILPPVAKTEIVKLLSAADLSISLFGPVPEMWHNSANKLFDALASATPIAINYGGWQDDFIKEYRCGVTLSSDDFEQSAQILSEFLNDKSNYDKAVQQCRYLAYHKFSRDIMAKRIEDTLLEAVND